MSDQGTRTMADATALAPARAGADATDGLDVVMATVDAKPHEQILEDTRSHGSASEGVGAVGRPRGERGAACRLGLGGTCSTHDRVSVHV